MEITMGGRNKQTGVCNILLQVFKQLPLHLEDLEAQHSPLVGDRVGEEALIYIFYKYNIFF